MQKILLFLILAFALKFYFSNPSIETSNGSTFHYSVKDDGNSKITLPMLIVLHGNGDTMSNFYDTALDKFTMPLRIILIEGPLEYSGGYSWPYVREDFVKYGDSFDEVVHTLQEKFPTHQKPVLMGFSGGAMMTYYQAYKHGSTYSYIFAISGNMSKKLLGNLESDISAPIFAYHGKNDTVLGIGGGKNAYNLLKEADANITFNAFNDGHHGIFTSMKSSITKDVEAKLSTLGY